MSIAPGTRLGQYEVQDFIGQGAMGLVYRAYHAQLERTGAVKVMQAITPDANTVARFRHEAQAIARLRHPNIVDVYDFGEFEGTPYMIVEYVPGGSLAGKMADGLPDRATTLRYLRGIAAGLDYAHSKGIVHRDVKPANVLLTADDAPVLADFGLAKLMQGSSLKSMTGVTTGTPAYMSPEQVTGGQVGPAADRYSLATIAYEMLTGVIPFDGEALMEVLYAQVHRYPSPPSARMASVGPDVDAVIMRGLAKNPADRWESCTAMVEALAAALEGGSAPGLAATMVMAPPVARTKPIAAAAVAERVAPPRRAPATVVVPFDPPAPAPTAAPPPPATPDPQPQPAKQPWFQPRRWANRRAAMVAAALLVLLLLLGICSAVVEGATLTVNPQRATWGQLVTVTASRVPANQSGEVQLWSIVHTYPFTADSKGNVEMSFIVPFDVALGQHTVKLCWNNSCPKQAGLLVVAGAGDAETTPAAGQTPGATPSSHPGSTPGSTPRPTSQPTSRPTSQPTSRPTANPTANPTSRPTAPPTASPTAPPTSPPTAPPTTNPCPGSSSGLILTPSSQSVLLNGSVKFSGSNFTPLKTITFQYFEPQNAATPTQTWTVTASCAGTFPQQSVTAGGLLQTNRVHVCDVDKGCIDEKVTVVLVLL